MALKKSELYSSLWSSCDELRGGMDASQYKDYVLTLLFMKYVSDKCAGRSNAVIEAPEGGSFADMVKLKGDKEIGDKINKIIGRLAEANELKGVIESADGKFLSVGMKHAESDSQDIASVDIQTGAIQKLYTWTGISHVQFSKYNPNLLRFSNSPHRMWWIDTREPGKANKLHQQVEGELVTHEDWWVDDQMTFCGGYLVEESHVKIIDLKTQTTRVIGAGSWWAEGTPKEVSEYNWWHASGAPNGRWVVADNWHGHIAIIDAQTTRLRHLTKDHRIYGGGDHPHVGWAPDSKSVEFSSLMRGNTDVCIAYLPEEWE